MSRAATGDTVTVKPTANIYTVLTIAGLIAVVLALVALFLKIKPLLGDHASLL